MRQQPAQEKDNHSHLSSHYIRTCFFILLLFVTVPSTLQAQNCPPNIDYEMGDFRFWDIFAGSVNATGGTNNIVVTPSTPIANRHEIIGPPLAGVLDTYGRFPVRCPNGSGYSVKLGNNSSGAQSERISYTFTIPVGQNDYSLTYYYAVVFQDPGHLAYQQPRFTARVYDVNTNDVVGCSSYEYIASSTLPGFTISSVNPQVWYKDWTPATIDLSGSAGKTLRLEFTTADCTLGGHFGYAYVDVVTSCTSPVFGWGYCTGAASVTLTAPFGYQDYFWHNANFTQALGSGQTITISPPPANGTVIQLDLVPYNGFGCRDTLPVTMVAETKPDTPVAVSYHSYCQNATAPPLSATAGSGLILRWYNTPTGGTAFLNPPVPSTAAPGITDYYVSQSTPGGCESDRKKITVEIFELPSPQFTVNNTLQCVNNNQFTFTNTSTNVNNNTLYTWTFGDNSPAVNTFNATHQYATPGSYIVTLRVVNGNNSCIDQRVATVTVFNRPTADFTAGAGCQGDFFSFTNTSTGGEPTVNQYFWDFGGGVTSTLQNPSVPLNAVGPVNVRLRVTAGGCVHDTVKTINIPARPVANFSFNNACAGSMVSFTDNSTIALGNITDWFWDFGGGVTSTLQNPVINFPNAGTYPIRLTARSGNCQKDTVKSITIYEKPIAYFKQTDSACFNAPVRFTDSSYVPGGSSTITQWWWHTGNGNTYTVANPQTTYGNTPGTYSIQQVVRTAQGCVSDTNRKTVVVHPLPIPRIHIIGALCSREITFADSTPGNITAREWFINNAPASTQQSFQVNNLSPGNYTIRLIVTNSFGCRSLPVDSVITINLKPSFDFTWSDSCLERPIQFTATDNIGNYITQWRWHFGSGFVNGTAGELHRFPGPGLKRVSLYAIGNTGCISDTMTKFINIRYDPVRAGTDRIAAAQEPIQLQASGNNLSGFEWTPSTGLNDAFVANPVATNTASQLYKVKARSVYGCDSYSQVAITIYKGPDIYMPTAFSPNNDGTNDKLIPVPVGVPQFKGINIYNRYGQLVYNSLTTNGWDGKVKGVDAPSDTYVWEVRGVDFKGKAVYKKGIVVLVR
jgi:gliding motility-associated-like protein